MITLLPLLTAWLSTSEAAAPLLVWTNSAAATLEAAGRLAGALLDLVLA
ncbi:hypothetical protein [Hymenobacter jeollabukensis]|nr:hypothetical protein [Hymenobacter jeollabukensis]